MRERDSRRSNRKGTEVRTKVTQPSRESKGAGEEIANPDSRIRAENRGLCENKKALK